MLLEKSEAWLVCGVERSYLEYNVVGVVVQESIQRPSVAAVYYAEVAVDADTDITY